jgi:TRAP-type C4-dicarboxylate transport system permease small subunit
MKALSRFASIAFGGIMLALSALITVETLLRKFFSVSLGGVDELSGYAVAVGAPLAFAVALIDQAHIRINLLHQNMPLMARAVLNALSAVALGLLALGLCKFALDTLAETREYQSLAQTPWATPLVYPQTLWAIALAVFAVPAAWLALRALVLLVRRDWPALNRSFGPESVADELEAELADLGKR